MALVILAKIEVDDSEPLAFPPDYTEKLLDPQNWNDFDREFDNELIPADELRSMLMEVSSVTEIEIVSVKRV